jgi:hypothetical protein
MINQRLDFIDDAVSALTDTFDKPVNRAFISTFAKQVQDIENVAFAVLQGRTINTAVGVQLDGLGELVGAPRAGRTDDTYRVRIRAQIALNLSSGTPDEILRIVQLMVGSAKLAEYFPASFIVDSTAGANPTSAATALEISSIVKAATPAGVRSQHIYAVSPASKVFRFSSSNVSEMNPDKGFANLAQTTGGKLAGVSTNG